MDSTEKLPHQLVADEILNVNFEVLTLNKKSFTVYPPTITTFARMVSVIEKVEFKSSIEALKTISNNNLRAAEYLTYAILGNRYKRFYGRFLFWLTYRKVIKSTAQELKVAIEQVSKIIGIEDFFVCAALMLAATKTMTQEETRP